MKHTLIIFAILFYANCTGLQVKDRPTCKDAASEGIKGNQNGWQAIEKALKDAPPAETPNLHRIILEELGHLKHPQSPVILKPYLTIKDEQLRSIVQQGFFLQKGVNTEVDVEKTFIDAVTKNEKEYNGLSRVEISLLGKIDMPESLEILRRNLGKNPQTDVFIIEAVGEKIKTNKDSPPPVKRTDSHSSLLPPPSNKKTSEIENSNEVDAIRTLTEYLHSDHSEELTRMALRKISESHSGRGYLFVLKIARDRMYPLKTRVLAIEVASQNKKADADEIISILTKLYFTSSGIVEIKEQIIKELALLQNKTQVDVLKEFRLILWKQQWRSEQIALRLLARKRYFQTLKNMPPRKSLTELLKSYSASKSLADRLHVRIQKVMELPTGDRQTARQFFYAALKKMYPSYGYHELKEKGLLSLNQKKLFTSIMALIFDSYETTGTIDLVLQKVWDVKKDEADLLRRFFSEKFGLLYMIEL